MKKFLILIVPIVMAAGCLKSESPQQVPCDDVTVTAPASEITSLRNYLQSKNITATEDPRGFFYKINNPGTGTKPKSCSDVTVDYIGKLTDGTLFDSNTNISFNLTKLIIGWQEGLPLIGTGGSITLYIPPSLGYGPASRPGIPGNSNLIFDINLKAVN